MAKFLVLSSFGGSIIQRKKLNFCEARYRVTCKFQLLPGIWVAGWSAGTVLSKANFM